MAPAIDPANLLLLAVQAIWGIALLFMTMYLRGIKRDVEICVEDTKDSAKSIAVLSERQAKADTQLATALLRLDTVSKRTHDMMNKIVAIETRYQMGRGGE